MGMDCYVEKIAYKTLTSFQELEDFKNYYGNEFTETIYMYRKHYWLDNFFRNKCQNSRHYDEVILTKQDIETLVREIEFALLNNVSNFDKTDFYSEDVISELKNVLKDCNSLLENEDFENNTVFYYSCS